MVLILHPVELTAELIAELLIFIAPFRLVLECKDPTIRQTPLINLNVKKLRSSIGKILRLGDDEACLLSIRIVE